MSTFQKMDAKIAKYTYELVYWPASTPSKNVKKKIINFEKSPVIAMAKKTQIGIVSAIFFLAEKCQIFSWSMTWIKKYRKNMLKIWSKSVFS